MHRVQAIGAAAAVGELGVGLRAAEGLMHLTFEVGEVGVPCPYSLIDQLEEKFFRIGGKNRSLVQLTKAKKKTVTLHVERGRDTERGRRRASRQSKKIQ